MAVANNRYVLLFDEHGEGKDKFPTKPSDPKAPKSYRITSMAWAPDSARIAVAQSDSIVFVYSLGLDWGDDKKIARRFPQSSPVTTVAWPKDRPNEFFVATAEGKVKLASVTSGKAPTLYNAASATLSLAAAPDGAGIVTAHSNGSVHRFVFDNGNGEPAAKKLARLKSPPSAVAWGADVIAIAGPNHKITFVRPEDGGQISAFEYPQSEPEFTTAAFSPSGQSLVAGSYNKFRTYVWAQGRGEWEEAAPVDVPQILSVTALTWAPDGSRIGVGSAAGTVAFFDAALRRYTYKGRFDLTYVSASQVNVKDIESNSTVSVSSIYNAEIEKINIFQDKYVVARTSDTLIVGDLSSAKTAEVPWSGSGNEKFYFEHDRVAMVVNAGELSLLEYGTNDILGSVRTEHVNPHLLSVVVSGDVKFVAYLIDTHTLQVVDLAAGGLVAATIAHDTKIDWLELSSKGTSLLFRDKRRQLSLVDVESGVRSTLLAYCSYVQWVPDSDVVVAQNRGSLCIWYSLDTPERVTIVPIKGDVTDIVRGNGKTEVIVDEGLGTSSYGLDENLILFGSAIDGKDFDRAVETLEGLEMSPETEAMWRTLADIAMEGGELHIAERCHAALGNISKVRYIHKVNTIAENLGGGTGDSAHYAVKAKMAALRKDFKQAEMIYIQQNQVTAAMAMYQDLHRWEDTISVAESRGHPETENLKRSFYQYLLDTRQEERAAELKEKQGDYIAATNLYLKGGLPGRAAALSMGRGLIGAPGNEELMERIATALYSAGQYERAGEFLEKLGQDERALDSYLKGAAYRRAVTLARGSFPDRVVKLEEEWGDHLMAVKQYHNAVTHYVECGKPLKAMEAATRGSMWKMAEDILPSLSADDARPYMASIGGHYKSTGNLRGAEKLFIAGGAPASAVNMYLDAGMGEEAFEVANKAMDEEAAHLLFAGRAQEAETAGKWKAAENFYVWGGDPGAAISMYKHAERYDDMIRLVSVHHPDLVVATHTDLASKMQNAGDMAGAEKHFVAAGSWKAAVNMYATADRWDEAIRVARSSGGTKAAHQVIFGRAVNLEPSQALPVLSRHEVVLDFIDWVVKKGDFFEHGIAVAQTAARERLPDLYVRAAEAAENAEDLQRAQELYIQAEKPKEAVAMWIHQRNFEAARGVAENHDPGSLKDVLLAQGAAAVENGDWGTAERVYLNAGAPKPLIEALSNSGRTEDALRVAREHAPNMMSSIQTDSVPVETLVANGQHSKAIDKLLASDGPEDKIARDVTQAVKLAMKFVIEREMEVVERAAARLATLGRHEEGGDLWAGVDRFQQAVEMYVAGSESNEKLWTKARTLAATAAQAGDHELQTYVEEEFQAHAKNVKNPDELVELGFVSQGLEALAKEGKWDEAMKIAEGAGSEAVDRYGSLWAHDLAKAGNYTKALSVFTKYGVPILPQNMDLYQRLSTELIASRDDRTTTSLRSLLYKLVEGLKGAHGVDPSLVEEFERLLMVSHLSALESQHAKSGHKDLAAKTAMSLVRYSKILPADLVAYNAGSAAREAGWKNSAFVFFNRYIDLADAMDEPEGAAIDNSDFEGTDVPGDVPLPSKHAIPEEERDEVSNYVISLGIDDNVDPSLPVVPCESCGEEVYEGSLECMSCHATWPPCVVTGFPVRRSTQTSCQSCGKQANRNDWTKFTERTKGCPFCGGSV